MNNRIVKIALMSIIFCMTSMHASALVIAGQIEEYEGHAPDNIAEVDFYSFSSSGGKATFDIFAIGFGEGNFDSQMWLFNDDGALDVSDIVTSNDDAEYSAYFPGAEEYKGAGHEDGSSTPLDSLIDTVVDAGNYILAVGMWSVQPEDVIDGVVGYGSIFNGRGTAGSASALPDTDYFTVLDYQLTITGAVDNFHLKTAYVSEPSSLVLMLIGLMAIVVGKKRRLIG